MRVVHLGRSTCHAISGRGEVVNRSHEPPAFCHPPCLTTLANERNRRFWREVHQLTFTQDPPLGISTGSVAGKQMKRSTLHNVARKRCTPNVKNAMLDSLRKITQSSPELAFSLDEGPQLILPCDTSLILFNLP